MTRLLQLLAGLALTTATALTFAQDAPTLDGKWSATFANKSGADRQAELVIEGHGGSWKVFANARQAKNNACLGRSFPIAVETTSATELRIRIEASSAVEGCGEGDITAKVVDGKTLEGQFGDGRPIRLVRP